MNLKFEKNKILRELKKNNKEYEFKRFKLDRFKQQTNEVESVTIIKGIYHEVNNYISITDKNETLRRTKKQPMVLCLLEDASLIQKDDIVELNNKVYSVNGINDIQEWGIIADISLEVLDDGI